IKILLPQHASDPDIVKRFIREARLYAKLEHPNLINIYETGIAEGTAFIVMKYVKGENLKTFIQKDVKTRLSLAPGVIEALSGALNYIHEKGIIHRDIKPANIILEDGGDNIYLADFGIARSVSSQTMTQTGSIMGTPYYISPEQIKGGVVDQRSDIYALGATLYELVTGKPVFSADSSVEILYKHVNSEPEQIGKVTPEISKRLKYIITRCLEKNPDKRFQSAIDISETISGRKSSSITKYLNAIESGRKNGKKHIAFVILSLIIIPLIAFLIYKNTTKSGTEISKDMQNNISRSNIRSNIEKDSDEIPAKLIERKDSGVAKLEEIKTGNSGSPEKTMDETSVIKKDKLPLRKDQLTEKRKKNRVIPVEKKIEKIISDKPGILRFSSFPPADIYWNGLKLGDTTQIFKKEFPPGKYKFTFKIEGYMSEEKEISVEPGRAISAHHRFSPYGFLTITARPFAGFFINGKDYGENPIFQKKFPVGKYIIRAVKRGYTTEERVIVIENMKKANISFSLKKEDKK
ncbi:MAG: serine/threonine protein kinase, partial [Candidatus Aminicenantes bacterium]|nr:serine/threonine protein kinase [Candidatus Aminicenantes bacterium]